MVKRFFAFTSVIFALYWIGFSQVVLLGARWPECVKDIIAAYLVFFSFITAFAGLAVIMRKKWARKFILLVCCAGILNIGAAAPFIHREINAEVGTVSANGEFHAIDTQRMPKPSSLADAAAQGAFLGLMEGLSKGAKTLMGILTGIIEAAASLYLVLLILIFRRQSAV